MKESSLFQTVISFDSNRSITDVPSNAHRILGSNDGWRWFNNFEERNIIYRETNEPRSFLHWTSSPGKLVPTVNETVISRNLSLECTLYGWLGRVHVMINKLRCDTLSVYNVLLSIFRIGNWLLWTLYSADRFFFETAIATPNSGYFKIIC